MKRVLIVDDHVVVRDGVKHLLENRTGGIAFGDAENAAEALKLATEQVWDLAILDISLGGRGGLDLLYELRQLRPRLPIAVLTMHPEEQYARRALKAGASGYITKDTPRHELIKAFNRLLEGDRYVSSTVAEILVTDLARASTGSPHESLSRREFEVMRLIASGKTNMEIAQLLSLSDKTISTYRARLLEKMGLKNNAELIHHAVRNRLFVDQM
jgi:two-component system, NarL family, invasion response regulator UvrY